MKIIFRLSLGSIMLAGLSEQLPAQFASGVALAPVALSGRELGPSSVPCDNVEEHGSIPLEQVGATAIKKYSGDGLSVCAIEGGAHLRCVFQRLEGQVTSEGLWLTSTLNDRMKDRFRVIATSLGRSTNSPFGVPNCIRQGIANPNGSPIQIPCSSQLRDEAGSKPALQLQRTGIVAIDNQTVRFIRPGLIEEYSVTMDGVRQDFVIQRPPEGNGELRVELMVTGAGVEPLIDNVRLVLGMSGRKIAYNRLRVTDAKGRELPARTEILASQGLLTSAPADASLAVVVNDASAIYPVRIDPTFSDANWNSVGGIPGADGVVRAVAVDALGNLYIGGSFTNVGAVVAANIAKWNGSSWSALGPGIGGSLSVGYASVVYALAVSGSNLYAAGYFSVAGTSAASNIAKWDGKSWSALGLGTDDSVVALLVSGSDLYAGGNFTTAGGTTANRIAKWNGTSWSALGSGANATVSALAVSGSDLYAGGFFTNAGGISANYVAKWNGANWSPLGSGVGGYFPHVYALAVSGNNLYVGGYFSTAGIAAANNIAKWNGNSWSALGSGVDALVVALVASGNQVFAGGEFTTAGGNAANFIAKWDGSSWAALGSGMFDPPPYAAAVYSLAVLGSDLYAGGDFSSAGSDMAYRVAKWNGSSWSGLGSVMSYHVYALAVSGSSVCVGGRFTRVGNIAANHIAKWDGSSWSALGSGIGGSPLSDVYALALSGSDVYAGGVFTNAGGIGATNIAKWSGGNWSALSSGISGPPDYPYFGGSVSALAVLGSNVYVGGNFSTAGNTAATNIAKWNGTSWSPLGSGVNASVIALAVSGSDLFAGGEFTTAGGIIANRIARWDGSNWFPLGPGVNTTDGSIPYVSALAARGTNLYVAGNFRTAGGIVANFVAKWDGSTWSALGSGIVGGNSPYVNALAVSGTALYAGGSFLRAGASTAYRIAKWDGNSWSPLGLGMNDSVRALAVSGSELYAGGFFTAVGDKPFAYIARARIESMVTSVAILNSTAWIAFSGLTGYQYDVERAISLNPPVTWTTLTTIPLSPAADGSFTFNDTNACPGTAYYRTVVR